jgi:hypothetical protein
VAQEAGNLAYRLSRALVGDTVNGDDGDAVGCHRRDLDVERAADIAVVNRIGNVSRMSNFAAAA